MYTIVDGIATMNSQFDILLIGQRGVGKSTLLRKYVMGTHDEPNFESSDCLVYKSVEMPCRCGSRPLDSTANKQISILDSSAGVDTLLTHNAHQVNNAQTIVFAYSAASSESFESLEYTINCIESVRGILPPCVIVSLKPDFGDMGQVSANQGKELAESCGALSFMEAYLYDDGSVDAVFAPLVDVVLRREEHKLCMRNIATEPNHTIEELNQSNETSLLKSSMHKFKSQGDQTTLHSKARTLPKSRSPRPSASMRSSATDVGDASSEPSVHEDLTDKFSDFRAPLSKSDQLRRFSSRCTRSLLNEKPRKSKAGCCIIM
ncbi:hypothetical protein JCM33374_g710 [Metschnikowia sp. JCM 33374]|nr:hypothetical protein JCM33374_g710 [Metschnikowia sp. JCM 33374]